MTYDVTVTWPVLTVTPNLTKMCVRYSRLCATNFTFASVHVPEIFGEEKRAETLPPPPAVPGGWSGGPAPAGLTCKNI